VKKTIVYLIRHGDLDNPNQVVYGRTIDLSLSQEGMQKIYSLANKIKERDEAPISIYSSPLRRTIQTSEILSKEFGGVPVVKDDGLIEIASSEIDGKPLSFLADLYRKDEALLQKKYGFEDFSSVAERMMRTLDSFRIKNNFEVFFLVSHGDPLSLLFWKLLNPKESVMPLRAKWTEKYLKKGESWRVVFGTDGFEGYDHISHNIYT